MLLNNASSLSLLDHLVFVRRGQRPEDHPPIVPVSYETKLLAVLLKPRGGGGGKNGWEMEGRMKKGERGRRGEKENGTLPNLGVSETH